MVKKLVACVLKTRKMGDFLRNDRYAACRRRGKITLYHILNNIIVRPIWIGLEHHIIGIDKITIGFMNRRTDNFPNRAVEIRYSIATFTRVVFSNTKLNIIRRCHRCPLIAGFGNNVLNRSCTPQTS